MASVGMISLGCEKNRVDAEMMMARLQKAGYELVDDASCADVAIVNTCGFIEAAKKESIGEDIKSSASRRRPGKSKRSWSPAAWRSAISRRSARSCPRPMRSVGLERTPTLWKWWTAPCVASIRSCSPKRRSCPCAGSASIRPRSTPPISRSRRAATTAAPIVRFH